MSISLNDLGNFGPKAELMEDIVDGEINLYLTLWEGRCRSLIYSFSIIIFHNYWISYHSLLSAVLVDKCY